MKSIQSKNITPHNSNHLSFQKESKNNFFGKNDKPFFNASSIQAKLTVNQPNDPYEKEADSMADKVVQRLNDKTFSGSENNSNRFFNKHPSFVQRKCASCDKEEKLQKKEEAAIPTTQPQPAPAPLPVFVCSKDLATSPIGKHTFFRLGGAGSGNSTFELEPEEIHPGCFQGVPQRDFVEDFNSDAATCLPTSITESCLRSEHARYPAGKYCTWGPNSNTYVSVILANCGAGAVIPPGWLPGFRGSIPPAAGTFAPSPNNTLLLGCSETECTQPNPQAEQIDCVKNLGLCSIPGGIPTDEDIHRWNEECRNRTHYEGDDITRVECP